MITWLLGLAAIVALLGGIFGYGHHIGAASVQADWDQAKVEARAAQDAADESARLREHAAATRYEEKKAVRVFRAAAVTKELTDAIDIDASWRDQPLPAGVRDAIAAAREAAAASEPGSSVQLPAAEGADQRAIGPGLRAGDRKPGRLLGEAPGIH